MYENHEAERRSDAAVPERRPEDRTSARIGENRSDETPLLGAENTPLPATEPATEPVQADGSAMINQETNENIVPNIIPDNS